MGSANHLLVCLAWRTWTHPDLAKFSENIMPRMLDDSFEVFPPNIQFSLTDTFRFSKNLANTPPMISKSVHFHCIVHFAANLTIPMIEALILLLCQANTDDLVNIQKDRIGLHVHICNDDYHRHERPYCTSNIEFQRLRGFAFCRVAHKSHLVGI